MHANDLFQRTIKMPRSFSDNLTTYAGILIGEGSPTRLRQGFGVVLFTQVTTKLEERSRSGTTNIHLALENTRFMVKAFPLCTRLRRTRIGFGAILPGEKTLIIWLFFDARGIFESRRKLIRLKGSR